MLAPTEPDHAVRHHRTLFLSDIHLGTRGCKADELLDFLKYNEAETIFLVGDVVDFWKIKRRAVWLQSHNDVIQKLLRKVRKGTRVVLIPGNHDDGLRDYCGAVFGGIEIHQDFLHRTVAGLNLLVTHGDHHDVVMHRARWLAVIGQVAYEGLLLVNYPLNWLRRGLGYDYWSLSAYLKQKAKKVVQSAGKAARYEDCLTREANERGADGVVCGHNHRAADEIIEGVRYLNCGDWVESCTAIVEDHDGRLALVHWSQQAIDTGAKPVSLATGAEA